ncbi:hypothetical protein GP2_001_00190 [Gordonia paraffinivorans NBRC 108238]|uniref:Uncharacterized protein n=1 Tax=Gordonia paraffinivorans NBRC 108238 TaxID=1223543 RepID=A0ABQ0IF31_9ACTN|nr:hypothetical protein GP2_001_00190 [Gordonia paraffinivorans NBRC 108238]
MSVDSGRATRRRPVSSVGLPGSPPVTALTTMPNEAECSRVHHDAPRVGSATEPARRPIVEVLDAVPADREA